MADYDVIVIGAGAAGLSAAGLLAKEGKRVLVLERSQYLGGRAQQVNDEGFRVSLGGHLMEDPGSGFVRIAKEIGHVIETGPLSTNMAVWDHENLKWGSIRDRYAGQNRADLKKVIKVLEETPYEEFDKWDDRPLRDWLNQYTTDPGVHDLFEFTTLLECMTERWHEHSASDSLYVRKLHYGEARKAGYSFWPKGGWDGMFNGVAEAGKKRGAEIRLKTPVSRVVIENGKAKGVLIPKDAVLTNTMFEEDLITADHVISTVGVWNVLDIVPAEELPMWYAEQIRFLAQDKFRLALLGLQIATEEPCPVLDRLELSTWLHTPRARLSGFLFEQTAMDPETAPDGLYLYTMGGVIPGSKGRDEAWLRKTMDDYEEDMKDMYPGFRKAVWRRRSLIFNPPFGVVQMPGLVGQYRPHWRCPNIEGLWFASETFRSRMIGTDRAARAALTVVEEILGRRLWSMEETWRY